MTLRGLGVDLVIEIEAARKVQASLEEFYGLDHVGDVAPFISRAKEGARETLFVRDASDGFVEISLSLPRSRDLDGACQLIEGVSHFVYVATRASQDRATTALELEVQAEVDKYVVLAHVEGSIESLDVERSTDLRERLYERVAYLHDGESELGERYRVANRAASRFVRRMEREHVAHRRFGDLQREMCVFFRSGQEDKLRYGDSIR